MQISYNNIIIDVKEGTKVKDLLGKEIIKSEVKVLACKFNNEVKSLNFEIKENGKLDLIDVSDDDGIRIYIRGLLYIICKAFEELYPKTKMIVNYQLYNAMYCETDNFKITSSVIKNIDKRVKEIIKKNLSIEKHVMNLEEAEKFYNKNDTIKGRLQIQRKNNITLYYCENYYNYFYGVLPVTTGFADNYEIVKYRNGFLVRYPNKKQPNKLLDFKETPKLFSALKEYDDMHKVLNIETVYRLNKIVAEGKTKDYILVDEALHEKKIAKIADEISKNKKIKLIAIAGPSSSGKTTFAKRLGVELRVNGLKPVTISVDDYFVEREQTPKDKNGNYDFETIKAVDTELLNKNILKLLNGETILAPKFDFHVGTKKYDGTTMKLAQDEVLVMEGIHCLNDKLTYLISNEQKFKIYTSCLTVLNMDRYNRISTTDTRLIRRIVRDNKFRGYSAEHTLQMWPSVNAGEIENIFEYQEEANEMFNSSLIYELGILKSYAMPLLAEINEKSQYYSEARRLLSILSYFKDIDEKYVPNNSLLKEFIGGSIFD